MCVISAYQGFWRTSDLHDQNEYVFCLPSHSLFFPLCFTVCLTALSSLSSLEYQIIAKSSAKVNRFFFLLWNCANFWQLKMYFFVSPDLSYNPISYLQKIPQLIFLLLLWKKKPTSTARVSFPHGSFTVVIRQ